MKYLVDSEKSGALEYINKAVQIALSSTCKRAKCGSIIVKDNEIIGSGFNSPPKNREAQRRCFNSKDSYNKKVTDKTCCIHAEQRAIIDALTNNPNKIVDSRLYFIRLDNNGLPLPAGAPYCTICSKLSLDVGIKEFVLLHEKGICVYNTDEYNTLSFKFNE